jgi:hypothetical protein
MAKQGDIRRHLHDQRLIPRTGKWISRTGCRSVVMRSARQATGNAKEAVALVRAGKCRQAIRMLMNAERERQDVVGFGMDCVDAGGISRTALLQLSAKNIRDGNDALDVVATDCIGLGRRRSRR